MLIRVGFSADPDDAFMFYGLASGRVPAGDIEIELLTDAGGIMYRNPYQAAEQTPDNDRAPLFVALDMDIAVFAKDPKGNAVMAQTILGVHGRASSQ